MPGKLLYAAGESGEIVATFKFGSRVGHQEKKIVVETDDPKAPRAELTLIAEIPNPVQIRPTFLYWKSTEPLTSKAICVEGLSGFKIKSVSVISTDPRCTASSQSVAEDGKRCEVAVVPRGRGPIRAILKITVNEGDPDGKVVLGHVYAE